jgi:hypothetical protein
MVAIKSVVDREDIVIKPFLCVYKLDIYLDYTQSEKEIAPIE